MIYVAGLDLGQTEDFSALAILEVHGTERVLDLPWGAERVECEPISALRCRHLERFPLQTKYGDIVTKVRARMRALPGEGYLSVDRTGVGRGVFDMMGSLNPIGVTITAGDKVQPGDNIYDWKVPKKDLVGGTQIALQNDVLTIASRLPMAEKLSSELLNFKAKISDSGHESFNAWRESDKDDMVLAVAIAVWVAKLIIQQKAAAKLQAIQRRQLNASFASQSISPY